MTLSSTSSFHSNSVFSSIEELVEEIQQQRMVILVDDENRENEGDLVMAGIHVQSQDVNFMISQARGLVCLAISPSQAKKLNLKLMVDDRENKTPNKTAFTISIEASKGVTTGISAADRARTILVASQSEATEADISSPGHVFPILAKPRGVFERQGHTEAGVDLVKIAGQGETAVICEIMNEDGTMARLPDLFQFAQKFGLKVGTIESLIQYRKSLDSGSNSMNSLAISANKETFYGDSV